MRYRINIAKEAYESELKREINELDNEKRKFLVDFNQMARIKRRSEIRKSQR
jgi:hypothetical protein